MIKIILGVLLCFVMQSCSTAVKKNTILPNMIETNKKNLGNLLALYPKPMTVVGSEVEGKVNWLVVGHTGIIGHDRILVPRTNSIILTGESENQKNSPSVSSVGICCLRLTMWVV